jgi:hypothetical protein
MSGQDWSINIIPAENSTAAEFIPDLLGAKVNDPLQTGNADIVSWYNQTGDPHQPWPLQANGQPYPDKEAAIAAGVYLADEIPAGRSSSPGYVTTGPASGSTTIDYICKIHPQETGSIVVTTETVNLPTENA